MAAPYPSDNIYLRKGFEPIRFECDYADLVVEGEIPQELSGTLYRIGPNPQFAPRGAYNPLLGDGMIHAFRIHRGKVSYCNRWVRTEQWKLERAAGQALFATSAIRASISM
jgi:carotenoid cleavage dioxygenase